MAIYNPAFAATLAAAATKLDWSTAFQNGLPAPRRIRMFRDANANAADPSVTGVEFMNVGTTGNLVMVAGNITSFGVLAGVTVNHAADVSTGACMLTIESGSNIAKFSLGLSGSGKEYMLSANPTGGANMGIAFSSGAGLRAPIMLDSGTGFASPPIPNYTAEIQDWTGGAFQSVVGVLTPSRRLINWVYDDQEMADSQGDVLTMISPVSVVHGEIEFGLMLWALNGATNAETADPVDELLVTAKPVSSNWPGYPRYSSYNPAVSNTYAPPYKVVLKKDGVTIKVFEMRDGLAINDQTLNQWAHATSQQGNIDFGKTYFRGVDAAPIRPFVGCAVVLPFRSHRLKMHTYAAKYFPGQEPEVLRPSTAKEKASCNAPFPMSYAANTNGLNMWHGMVKWAPSANITELNQLGNNDPMLFNPNDFSKDPHYGSHSGGSVYNTGWGYEPGANGGHDWWTGNGGARIDRGFMAGPIAIYMTNPTYVHLRDNTPIQEMVDNWNLNYCNIPWHMITDVTTGDTIPYDEVCNSQWSQGGNTYYGGQDTYVAGGRDKSINFLGWGNGPTFDYTKPFDGAVVDKNLLMPFHGASTDFLHPYKSAAHVAYLFNSPMAAYLTKFAVINVIIAQLGDVPADAYPGWFLVRQHAWRFKAYMEAWKLSSDHPWGMQRAATVKRFKTELETIYNTIYTTAVLNNGQDLYSLSLVRLGLPLAVGEGSYTASLTQSLMFYMGGVLQQMKATGCWDYMRAQSVKCRVALDFIVQCMDRYSIDWIIETNGQYDWYEYSMVRTDAQGMVADWAEVAANRRARLPSVVEGQPEGNYGQDWVTNLDGSRRGESDGSQHLRYQWACIRRDWITETEVPRGSTHTIADGIAKYKGYYDVVTARVNAAIANDPNDAFGIRAADWSFRQPMYGVILPPQNT